MKKFKKLLMVGVTAAVAMTLTACGGSSEAGGESVADPVITPEIYAELEAAAWGDMTFEEMEEFLGVKGVVDEEGTESWGEGYLVADFPGPDDESRVHVLYKEDADGEMTACSLSPTGQLHD